MGSLVAPCIKTFIMTFNANYERVFPRDFFNEAKLLKCMGILSLLIHDGFAPKNIKIFDNSVPPIIGLSDEGYLSAINYPLFINGIIHRLMTTSNSRSNYPLLVWDSANQTELEIFDDEGNLTSEFITFCSTQDEHVGPPEMYLGDE
jgi:hypothetical protein